VELLDKAKQAMVNEPKRGLWQFQNYLNEIHDWNMEKVNNEIHVIHVNSGCDYLEDLLTAVFIAHTKVLTAIRLSSNQKKVEINIPKVEHFLFKVLCETSKLLWSSTYLFREGISGIEKQQNYRTIEGILNEGILQAVRSLVPVKSILKDFVNGDSAIGDTSSEAAPAEEDSDDEVEKKESDIVIPPQVTISKSSSTAPTTAPTITPTTAPTIMPTTAPITPSAPIAPEPIAPPAPISVDIPTEEPVKETPSFMEKVKSLLPSMEMPPQTIIIEDKPTVRFGHFDAVFDSEDPDKSDMIFDPKDTDSQTPDLDITDSIGTALSEGLDFDSLDNETMNPSDYEEL